MIVKVDINFLHKHDLSPNEYIILYCFYNDITIKWNYEKDLENLFIKKYIDEKTRLLTEKSVSLFSKNFNDWLNDWRALWPTHLLPGGYRVSGNTVQVYRRMKKFMNDFPEFTPEIIIKATKKYIDNCRINNYRYMKKNAKFIYDNETSTLEQECLALINGEEKPQSKTRHI